jgi:inosose dehydratase
MEATVMNGDWRPRVGINPIVWTNDDFADLGDDIPLERCLAEMRAAGYDGAELGRKFPRQAGALRAALAPHGLQLVSGWHSLQLLERSLEAECRALDVHLDLLVALGCDVGIVAECSRRTYPDPMQRLAFTRNGGALGASEVSWLGNGLDALARHAAARGVRLAYHHHMGTVIQSAAEIDALMTATRDVGLLLDTGHSSFAGADPLAVLERHAGRIVHVHLKDVRPHVVRRARDQGWSFARAVRAGVFTVPGDGGIDFRPILARLRRAGYSGWLVVEAEQDPVLAPPAEYARRAREHLRAIAGV